jgi:hypothetical protein
VGATATTGAMRAERPAEAPRAGAIAGILFAVLFTASVALIQTTVDEAATGSGSWLLHGTGRYSFALVLMPFAGISFLWFIGVARNHLGRAEDQFFSTVFLGSGLLFLAMTFCAAGIAGAIVTSHARDASAFAGSLTYFYGRDVVQQIFTIYALRMAAVFVMSLATIWLRSGVMPRWLTYLSYAVGLVLLFLVTRAWWAINIFPAWVLIVSLYVLIAGPRQPQSDTADGTAV